MPYRLYEFRMPSNKRTIETYATVDLALAALQCMTPVFCEEDEQHAGCYDAFMADGRILGIEPEGIQGGGAVMLSTHQPANWAHVATLPPTIEDVWFFQDGADFYLHSDQDCELYLMAWTAAFRVKDHDHARASDARHEFYQWCEVHSLRPHFA